MANRIVILGSAGSGKSTLAKKIADQTGATLICLDRLAPRHFSQVDIPMFREKLVELHAGDHWVSDGNFATVSFDIRLSRATHVVWLEQSRLVCIRRAVLRSLRADEHHRFRDVGKVLRFI